MGSCVVVGNCAITLYLYPLLVQALYLYPLLVQAMKLKMRESPKLKHFSERK